VLSVQSVRIEELAELLRHEFTFSLDAVSFGCLSLFGYWFNPTVKLNLTTRVQIRARACTSVTLFKIRVPSLSARPLTLPAAKLNLCQGFSSDQWSWKRSRVGAHAVGLIDQWVTSEPVSILTLCCRLFTAFRTQQAVDGIYEQRRWHLTRHCVIRGHVALRLIF
jgi:hypothetical protein